MVNRYVMKSKHDLFFDCLPYEWRSATSDGLFLPIYPLRSMHVILCSWLMLMYSAISMAHAIVLPFCLLHNHHSIPPIVLSPWLTLMYFVKIETIAWLVIGVVHDLNTLCGEDRA